MKVTQPIPELTATDLRAIILSHGWFVLRPFTAYLKRPKIILRYALPDGQGQLTVFSEGDQCFYRVDRGPSELGRVVLAQCLSLDVDVAAFHQSLKGQENFAWIAEARLGRFLRSPSLFEDCCKVLFTTHTSWKRTEDMNARAIDNFGVPAGKDIAFPRPEDILHHDETTLKDKLGCGFRARYLINLCKQVCANPHLFLRREWQDMSPDQFESMLNAILGLGPVSVAYLCRLYGHPTGYAIDSWVVKRAGELWGIGKNELQEFFLARYREAPQYGPLILWFELTRKWHLEYTKNKPLW